MNNNFEIETDRRRNPNGNQHYKIKKMWESHHEISRLLLLGYNNQKIAKAIGITPQTVSNVRNDPIMKRKLAMMNMARDKDAIEISDRMKALEPIAIEVFNKVMNVALEDEDGVARIETDKDIRRDAIASAKIITDHQHPKETKVEHNVGYVTVEMIQEAKRRALEGGSFKDEDDDNKIEDAEFKEVEVRDEEGTNGDRADTASVAVDESEKSEPNV